MNEQMFGHCLKRIGRKKSVALLLCHEEAFQQQGKLLLVYVIL